jgi:hypothetical protein
MSGKTQVDKPIGDNVEINPKQRFNDPEGY